MAYDEQMVERWISCQLADRNSPEYDELFDSFMYASDLIHDQPDDAWQFILEVLRRNNSAPILEVLSAGPLEDLLARHGNTVIDRVESEARVNPNFALLLGGVWRNRMSEEIWNRVQAVWDRRGWDGTPAA